MKRLQELIMPGLKDPESNKNYIMDTIKTLWSLLDEPGDHYQIV
jgi:hypothetical protein